MGGKSLVAALVDALLKPMPGNPMAPSLAEAGYPNGFDAEDLTIVPLYFDMGESIVNYLRAVSIRVKSRPMERAVFFTALNATPLRGVCVCDSGRYGNAATRLEEMAVTWGSTAYGGYPDIDALCKQQAVETDHSKREALLHQLQQLIYVRVMCGPIWEYIWPSAIGPRGEESALMLINPYPWPAPLEDVRLKPE